MPGKISFRMEHISLWTRDLERMKDFYVSYFDGIPGEKYINPKKKFESYFIRFSSGARLEIMRKEGMGKKDDNREIPGYAHLAFSVGSRENVDSFTCRMKEAGVPVVDGPRLTGDGYYESVILDPDGNRIEITV